MIDWTLFSVDAQARWERAIDMKNDLALSQSTVMAAWHGKPIGLVPFLSICHAMSAHPLRYFERKDTQ